jgi:hypothetical protein
LSSGFGRCIGGLQQHRKTKTLDGKQTPCHYLTRAGSRNREAYRPPGLSIQRFLSKNSNEKAVAYKLLNE